MAVNAEIILMETADSDTEHGTDTHDFHVNLTTASISKAQDNRALLPWR